MTLNSKNRRCLYCGRLLASNPTNEHIIWESLGGSLASDNIICSHCNQYFSQNVDNWTAKKFSWVLNALGPATKNGGPSLQGTLESCERVRVNPGMVVGPSQAKIERLDGGKVVVFANNQTHGKKILKSMGKPTETAEVINEISASEGHMLLERLPIFSDGELRGAGKALSEFFYLQDSSLATNNGFKLQRRYVRTGERKGFPPTIYSRNYEETRKLFDKSIPPTPFCHRIAVSMGPKGVVGLLVLFDAIAYLAQISDFYLGKPRTGLYQRNILKGAPQDQTVWIDMENPLGEREELPELSDYLDSQGSKLRRLYAAANWHVEVNCKEQACWSYTIRLIRGLKPESKILVQGETILAEIRRRIDRIFFENIEVRELRQESDAILEEVGRRLAGKSWEITPEHQGEKFREDVWQAHLHAFSLHHKHISVPAYGIKSFGFVAEESA